MQQLPCKWRLNEHRPLFLIAWWNRRDTHNGVSTTASRRIDPSEFLQNSSVNITPHNVSKTSTYWIQHVRPWNFSLRGARLMPDWFVSSKAKHTNNAGREASSHAEGKESWSTTGRLYLIWPWLPDRPRLEAL